jgi:serine/threonine protein kinase
MEMVPTINGRHAPTELTEYAVLFQEIKFPEYVSFDARDIISRLLDVNDITRLGSGPKGIQDIKNHKFFSCINWEKLEQKHIVPPFIPEERKMDENSLFPNFESMMNEFGKGSWLDDKPPESGQKYFSNWYIIIIIIEIR